MDKNKTYDFRLPRLYVPQDLVLGQTLALAEGPAHYFRSVLRRQAGDRFRVFNGRDGEFTAEITALGKKDAAARPLEQSRAQPQDTRPAHLFFTPLKKQRMDILIEKAVELGVTDLHPVLTNRTDVRVVSHDRLQAQVIEAAEQCERMTIPSLHPLTPLKSLLATDLPVTPLLWCAERYDAALLNNYTGAAPGFLVGPAGGFDEDEFKMLGKIPGIRPVSLGETLYRAETAALLCLSFLQLRS